MTAYLLDRGRTQKLKFFCVLLHVLEASTYVDRIEEKTKSGIFFYQN